MAKETFWNNREQAQKLIDETSSLRKKIEPLLAAEKQLEDFGIMVELAEYDKVLEISRAVEPRRLKHASRHQAYWMSLGRALAHSGKADQEALIAFINAERAAPLAFSLNPLAHDALVAMVYRARRRAVPDNLRILARRVGVDVPV